MSKNGKRLLLGAAALSLAAAAFAQANRTLTLNGRVASRDVRVIGGRPYVPLADVAKALGQQVVTRPGGYEITAAGGANQIQGLQGKIGDTLFDGKWRFQALSVETVPDYKLQNTVTTDYSVYRTIAELELPQQVFRPRDGYALILVRCRVRNGLKNQNQALWWYNGDTRTALTDTKGESHPPIAVDAPEAAPFQSRSLLPGAGLDLNLLFSVPQGTPLKDLVVTLRTISEKGKDVRVSLPPG